MYTSLRYKNKKQSGLLFFYLAFFFAASFFLTLNTPHAFAATYYVDSVGGLDTNNGTSTGTPWQTLAKVSGFTFSPGDNILFLDGDTFAGSLGCHNNGSAGNLITYSDYGSGAKPIIDGTGHTYAITCYMSRIAMGNLVIKNATSDGLNGTMNNSTFNGFEASSNGGDGVQITATTNVSFTNSKFDNNFSHGIADFITTPGELLSGFSFNNVEANGNTHGSGLRLSVEPSTGSIVGNATSTWTSPQSNNIWQTAEANAPVDTSSLFFNHVAGTNQVATTSLTTNNQWTWISGTLYVYATSNPILAYSTIIGTSTASWTSAGSNTWLNTDSQIPASTVTNGILFNNILGTSVSSVGNVNSANKYYIASTGSNGIVSLYVYSTTNPFTAFSSPGIAETGLIEAPGKMSNIQLTNSTFSNNGTTSSADGVDISQNQSPWSIPYFWSDGLQINNVTASGNGLGGIEAQGFKSNVIQSYIENSTTATNGSNGTLGGIWTGANTGMIIQNNSSYNNTTPSGNIDGVGIFIDQYDNGVIARSNYVYGNTGSTPTNSGQGIEFYRAQNSSAYNNVVFNNKDGISIGGDISSGNTVYNNTSANNTRYQLSYAPTATAADVENNILYGGQYGFFATTAPNNEDYNCVGGASIANYSGASGGTHSNTNCSPAFSNSSSNDFTLQSGSAAIEVGTSTLSTTDYLGKSSYGVATMGAYQYQPPYTFSVNHAPATGSIRLYSDGHYRALTATSTLSTATFSVTPVGGTYTTATTSYMDIGITKWLTNQKEWIATSTSGQFNTHATSTVYTIGDLTPNTPYFFDLDGATTTTASANNSQCTNGLCVSDSTGTITFTYQTGYSTHTFDLVQQPTISGDSGAVFHGTMTVGLTSSSGSSIWYTTDGTTPACSVGTLYSTPLTFSNSTTINAITCDSFGNSSLVTTGTFSPASGGGGGSSSGYSSSITTSTPPSSGTATTTPSTVSTPTSTPSVTTTTTVSSGTSSSSSAQTPASGTSTAFTHTLSLGQSDGQVKMLQQFLNAHGFIVSASGAGSPGNESNLFGIKTYKALVKFQKSRGLPQTGWFGPMTKMQVMK